MASEIEFPVTLALRKVGPGAVLAEPLFFPEFARLGPNRALAAAAARRNLLDFIPRLDPPALLRRRRATAARALPFTVELPPPRATEAWRDPLVLTFHAVVWDHAPAAADPDPAAEPFGPRVAVRGRYVLARVAELGIEVIADAADDLVAALRREATAALRRLNLSTGLMPLARVQTTLGFAVERHDLAVRVPTLKDRAIRAERDDQDGKKPVLQQVATQLGKDRGKTYEADDTVRELARALTANPPQSVLLIGPSGVGKTAAVRELARRWRGAGGAPIFQTSGSRIVAGQTGFGMWQERCQQLVADAAKRKAVVHVGPLVELLDVGKSEHNSSGIATFLRPAVARGQLLCVAECTPEQLPLVEKQDPQLLDAFRHLAVPEPDAAKGRAILAHFARDNSPRRGPGGEPAPVAAGATGRETTAAALAATDRLHRRYATYSAYPGRPLRFLENLIRDGTRGTPVTDADAFDAFTRETGLPRAIIEPAAPLDLAETHAWFAGRVVGQTEAVTLVTDLLATVKAGLTRPNRPIASLLFIGPTGVGKTEMAKAVAEFLFGSKDRLTRFDMSEFADPVAVRRLVGGAFGTEGLLTAKVREQPFSVLLLDEVEKADGSFFDLLLQALGEARLTDAGGRLADFRNTVVILTSNLGAESYRRGGAGFASSAAGIVEAGDHFAKAVEQFLRPEMFNRLDRIVPFAPLGTDVIRRIADREWRKVLNRDGVRFRELAVRAAPAVLDHLAAVGFDPRYGARPLKRAMERQLLAPLAHQMNRYAGDVPLSVEVGVAGAAPVVSVKPLPGARSKSAREPTGAAGRLATGAQTLRRWHQLLAVSSAVRELTNDVYQLAEREQKAIKKQAAKRKLRAGELEDLAKLGRLRELAEEVARQSAAAFALEDAAVVAFHEADERPPADLPARLDAANRDWDKLLLRLYALNAPAGDRVTVALFGEHRGHLAELAAAYSAAAGDSGLSVEVVRYDLPGENEPPELAPERLATKLTPEAIERLRAASARGQKLSLKDLAPTPPPTALPARAPRTNPPSTASGAQPNVVWVQDRLFAIAPAQLLLKRVAVAATQPHAFADAGTVGVALSVTGTGSHLRFRGENGLHEILSPDPRDGDDPNVAVRTSADPLAAYCPPEVCVRRGWYRDERVRRRYDLTAGTMRDDAIGREWANVSGGLTRWVADALDANVRARLRKLVTE